MSARDRADLRVVHPDELVASFPDQSFSERSPFALHVKASHRGAVHEIGLVPDLVFGLVLADGARRRFMVEIDRGTMPVVRSNIGQTSFERRMRAYLTPEPAERLNLSVANAFNSRVLMSGYCSPALRMPSRNFGIWSGV